jgi:hypothetical protein
VGGAKLFYLNYILYILKDLIISDSAW